MEFEGTSQRVTWFRDRYREGSLELKPPFQRKPVWSMKQKQYLIESILLGLPIPELYLQIEVDAEEQTRYYVVDGQQRIRAVLQFIGVELTPGEEDWNRFVLDKLDASSRYRGLAYAELERVDKERLLTYSLAVRELRAASDDDVRDIFKRFNKYVTKLNDQEIRQATYSGPFMTLSSRLADDEYWVDLKLVTPAQIRRMKDIEFVSELLIGVIHGPQGGSAKVIDDYYSQYEEYEDEFPGQPVAGKRFSQVLGLIQRILVPEADIRFRRNRTDFYTLFIAIATLLLDHTLAQSEIKKLRTTLSRFATEIDRRLADEDAPAKDDVVEYVRAAEKGANEKRRRADRHAAILGRIKRHFRPARK